MVALAYEALIENLQDAKRSYKFKKKKTYWMKKVDHNREILGSSYGNAWNRGRWGVSYYKAALSLYQQVDDRRSYEV